ncbi:MAG: ABC transporter ATP-binding protein [Saccharofermentanales bacterium]
MIIEAKKYKLADFVLIPMKISPVNTIAQIINRIITALVPSIQILVTASFIDTALNIFNKKAETGRIYLPLSLLIAIIAYTYINWAIMTFVKMKLDMKLNEKFRIAMVEKRAKLEYRHVENNETWELINRVSGDPAGRVSGGFDIILRMADIIIRVVTIILILIVQVWWVALIIVSFSIPLLYIAIKGGKIEYDAFKEAAKHQRKAGYLQGIIQGRGNVEERTMFSYTEAINKRWYEKFEIARKINLKATSKMFIKMKSASVITILISLLIIGVLISPLSTGNITIGMFIGLVTATFNLVQMMSWELSYVAKEMANNKEYLKDLSTFSELSETPDALSLPDSDVQKMEFKSIEFKNVSFRYPGTENQILQDLSLKLDAKRQYAFVGVNGAGKTTLIKILTGLYDNFEGEIFINDKNIRDYRLSELKGLFSVVYQDFAKYYISLKENIALGNIREMADKNKAIYDAIKTIGLDDAVDKLPKGIDTYLGKIKDEGIDISGGEWQIVAIARALVSSAPIYILDEPTASLDPIAESNVYEMFGRVSSGKSTIFITHRLGAAKLADEIFVIDDGKVAEKGSHSELIGFGGIYARMFESQRSWYN